MSCFVGAEGNLFYFHGTIISKTRWIVHSNIKFGPRDGNKGLPLAKRDLVTGRGFCSVKAASGPETIVARGLRHVLRRDLEPFPDNDGDKDTFMLSQVSAAISVIVEPAEGDLFYNTAFYRSLGDDPINLAVKGLTGCSVLVVVSAKAVYFTHFFEERSFPTELGEEDPDQPVPTDFDGEVKDLLNNGRNDPFIDGNPGQIQESLQSHKDDFKGQEGLAAFLIVGSFEADPDADPPTEKEELYPTSSADIAEQVNDLIGISPTILQYGISTTQSGLEPDPKLTTTAKGKVLYQYDPQQGNGHGFRVIKEYDILSSYEW